MNERITELYVQANKYAQEEGFKKYDKAGDVNWKWEDTVFEKFAELIVKECADICEKYAEALDILEDRGEPADFFQGGVKSASRRNANAIKKHFGVKE